MANYDQILSKVMANSHQKIMANYDQISSKNIDIWKKSQIS